MYRFDGFTEKANNALNLALTSAEDMGHTYIGSEHIIPVSYTHLNMAPTPR